MSDLLLLSGGIDSTALAAWWRPSACLTIDYGQRAAPAEIAAASAVCAALGLTHHVLSMALSSIGAGMMSTSPQSPASSHPEFWPFRNQLLLTVGAMYASHHGLTGVLIGTVRTDQCRHADGSQRFLEGIAQLIEQQEGGIRIRAPAMGYTTAELIARSGVQPAVLGWTHSCHADVVACGRCPGCNKHSDVMATLGWHR